MTDTTGMDFAQLQNLYQPNWSTAFNQVDLLDRVEQAWC